MFEVWGKKIIWTNIFLPIQVYFRGCNGRWQNSKVLMAKRLKAMVYAQVVELPLGQAQLCWHLRKSARIIRLALTALAWIDSFYVYLGPRAEMTQLTGVPKFNYISTSHLSEENKQIPWTNHINAADSLFCTMRIFQLCRCASGVVCGARDIMNQALLGLVKSVVDYSHNFLFQLYLPRTSPTASCYFYAATRNWFICQCRRMCFAKQ